MIDNYINNFENVISSIFFVGFKVILVILIAILILSLILLAIGCLIKSQKIKSKFLMVVPSILFILLLFLAIPIIWVHFKNIV